MMLSSPALMQQWKAYEARAAPRAISSSEKLLSAVGGWWMGSAPGLSMHRTVAAHVHCRPVFDSCPSSRCLHRTHR